jgi:hypothetical protein
MIMTKKLKTPDDYLREEVILDLLARRVAPHYPNPKLVEEINHDIDSILMKPEVYDDPVQLIEDLEFKLQAAWGLSQDKNYHNRWNRIKGCSCPTMDNRERVGTPYRIHSITCKWHGGQ